MITISNLLYLEEIDMPCYDSRDDVKYQLNEVQNRLDRYVRQFCNLTHLLSDKELITLCATDKEFRDTFIEHQEVDRKAGRTWREVIVSPIVYQDGHVDVTFILHEVKESK